MIYALFNNESSGIAGIICQTKIQNWRFVMKLNTKLFLILVVPIVLIIGMCLSSYFFSVKVDNSVKDAKKQLSFLVDAVMIGDQQTDFNTTMGKINTSVRAMTATIIIGSIIAVLLTTIISLLITRSIKVSLNKIIKDIEGGSGKVSEASLLITETSKSTAAGAESQASAVEQVVSSLEEISSMSKNTAENLKQFKKMVSETYSTTENANTALNEMNNLMSSLKLSSDKTEKVIKSIEEIAFQTNLLALNAAVEAARAGESGKGFAVVAEEVRNLARRTSDELKNSSELIKESQKNANDSANKVVAVSKNLNDIVSNMQKVKAVIDEISESAGEQSKGLDQINLSIAEIGTITQRSTADADNNVDATKGLLVQSEKLYEVVNEMKSFAGISQDKEEYDKES
jgi:methyl-accepting chemotaxis protein